MYLRRIKYKNQIYYYLTRRVAGSKQEDRLTTLGMLSDPTPDQELQLITCWALQLLSGGENAMQKSIEIGKTIGNRTMSQYGKSFDLERCMGELRAIYLKYGKLTKTILEKQARPNGDLSWGTSTLLNQLRNRKMTLSQVFEIASRTP